MPANSDHVEERPVAIGRRDMQKHAQAQIPLDSAPILIISDN